MYSLRPLRTQFTSFRSSKLISCSVIPSGRAFLHSTSVNLKVKKIIVGCDGTWLNADDNFQKETYAPLSKSTRGHTVTASNVTRICRALTSRTPDVSDKAQEASDSALQIVNYFPGVGSASNWWDHYVNGATAASIGANVNQAYASLVEKYHPGDEIYLVGFSRGSFVARSVAAMVSDIGLLNKKGMEYFYDIFHDWENQNIPSWKQKRYPGKSMDDMNDGSYSSYALQLEADGLTRLGVRIKALGCWDTVGSLGIPTLGFRKPVRTYAFVNTEPPWNVDNCFQALALDERRMPFSPTLWELPASRVPGPSAGKNACVLRQCWFPGAHSNVGGSVDDAELPDITLVWMITQLAKFLEFDPEYLQFCRELNLRYYQDNFQEPRQWAMGNISNSFKGFQVLAGALTRTPGRFSRTDPVTGQFKKEKLENTHETIHPSVRIRMQNKLNGKGVDDKGTYDPLALKGYVLKGPSNASHKIDLHDPKQAGLYWEFDDVEAGSKLIITEEQLGKPELMLLDAEGLAPTA